MAKGNILLGQARGSVGDVVFSVENGEQISKVNQDLTSVQLMVEFTGTFDTCTLNSITI